MLKKKFKSCFQLRENIWDTSKVLKLKKIKWKFLKNKVKKNKQTNIRPLIFFFKQRSELYKLYKTTLNFKRKLICFCGPLRKKKLNKLIKLKIKNFDKKKKDGSFNNIYNSFLQYNKLKYIVTNFESLLCVVLLRSNILPSIFSIRKLIKDGNVLVNGIVVYNPKFNVKPNDYITFKDKNFFKNNISSNFKKKIKNLNNIKKKVNFTLKKLNQKIIYSNSNLLNENFNNSLYKNEHIYVNYTGYNLNYILYLKNPSILNLYYKTDMDWSLYNYILKLKRK